MTYFDRSSAAMPGSILRSSLAKGNAVRGTDEVNVESIRTPINMSIPSLVCHDTGAPHAFILRGQKGIIKKSTILD